MRTRMALFVAIALAAAACGGDAPDDVERAANTPDDAADDAADTGEDAADAGGPLTVYSGRSEELVGSVFDRFTDETGIEVEVRYGDTAELAAAIINEGDASPADVYWAQDAGALGALEAEGRLDVLPDAVLDLVDDGFRSRDGVWVGVTGRVRVLAYNTDRLADDEVPDSVFDLTGSEWAGRVSWAPTNGSFQSFVTAMRVLEGDDVTQDWLEGMIANDVQVFENNASQVEAVGRGEVDVALVNHYYLYRFTAEDPDFPADNHFLPGDVGGLVNVAGVGVLGTSDQPDTAHRLVEFLLSEDIQDHFGQQVNEKEYPLRAGVEPADLPPLSDLSRPAIDLAQLEDLQGTLELLQASGALE